MDKLRWLQLKNVECTGSYKNFPELRWLCWHRCRMKMIPSGLLMSSLVAIDICYRELIKFEPPMVLSSLKILNFKGCKKLVSIHNLDGLLTLEEVSFDVFITTQSYVHIASISVIPQTTGG